MPARTGIGSGGKCRNPGIPQAGYGKSTFVSQWLNDTGVKNAWLSLERADSDLPQFLAYVIAAIQTVFPDSCQEISACLQMASVPSPQELAAESGP